MGSEVKTIWDNCSGCVEVNLKEQLYGAMIHTEALFTLVS